MTHSGSSLWKEERWSNLCAMETRTDTELIAEFAGSGNEPFSAMQGEKAFAELVTRHQKMVFRTSLRMLGNAQDAQDATQATFIVLMKKSGSLTRGGDLGGWLHAVARRVSLKALQQRAAEARSREAAVLAMENDNTVTPEAAALAMEFLDTEIECLSAVQRQAVVLRYLEGHSQESAAHLASCPLGTMKRRASEGIAKLRARLTKRGVALSGVALAGLLASEASAAVPETLIPSILATVKAAVATTATATGATSTAAMLAKGAMKAMFWNSVKTSAMVAVSMGVVGVGGVAAMQAVEGKLSPPKPAMSETAKAPFNVPVAATFSSKAWRNQDASRDLAWAGIRVFHLGGWVTGANAGWATPAELRRRTMPPRDYVEAWAASRERGVLWSGSNTVAIIGKKAELENLKQRAGGDRASTEDLLSTLEPTDGRPRIEPEPDLDGLQKTFSALAMDLCNGNWDAAILLAKMPDAGQGKGLQFLRGTMEQPANEDRKLLAAVALCAAGNDEGLAFLKTKLEKDVPLSHKEAQYFYEPLGAHGGPDAIRILKTLLLAGRNQQWVGVWVGPGMALGKNGGSEALTVLREALQNGNPEIRYAAACGLEFIGGKEGLELGGLALANADPKVRRAGVYGLWRAHEEQALPSLEKALADEEAEVRGQAVLGLRNLTGDKARDLIQMQLNREKDASVLKILRQ